ncbi:radial spoke head protein 6 homolog A-like [Lycorma delicatula]|uniref:radial spoke head protein 6 homolog A-like n=1 Tax=Lycorma delicatula TaxID=130591 RepID=UPI003F51A552
MVLLCRESSPRWTHLSELLKKIIEERPTNVIDYFEQYSRRLKEERFATVNEHLRDVYLPPINLNYVKKQIDLLKNTNTKREIKNCTYRVLEYAKDMEATMYTLYVFPNPLLNQEKAGQNSGDKRRLTRNEISDKIKRALETRDMGDLEESISNNVKEKVEEEEEEEGVPIEKSPPGEEGDEAPASNRKMGFLEQMNFFKEAGVCLSNDECFSINVAIRKLSQTAPVKKFFVYRFWGKIFGTRYDYLIAECELTDEELNKRLEQDAAEAERKAAEEEEKLAGQEEEFQESLRETEVAKEDEKAESVQEEYTGKNEPSPVSIRDQYIMPPEPKPLEKVEIKIPTEKHGEGANKKVYYVCNEPGDEWLLLPNVTPENIVTARKIKKFFTGNLNKKIESYPAFNGTELNYLRAQIARITAGTQISPLGFYTFKEGGEEEEEVGEEEEETKSTYVENSDFEPLPMKDLVDPSVAFWVHHSQNILTQGRTKWWSPNASKGEAEGEGEEEEEEEEEEGSEKPEVGPPLLTPLSEDKSLESTPPWTVRNTSLYTPENAMAFVSSNLWPGAYSFAVGKLFSNIYVGWGHKYSGNGFSPLPLPFPENEYEEGPEVMEIDDPTPQAEEEWRLAHEKKPPPPSSEAEEELEEEDEPEED